MEPFDETVQLFPQEPAPEPAETRALRSKCSRAGLSVAVLYGAMSKAQSIAIILCSMVLSAWLLFRPLPDLDLKDYAVNHPLNPLLASMERFLHSKILYIQQVNLSHSYRD